MSEPREKLSTGSWLWLTLIVVLVALLGMCGCAGEAKKAEGFGWTAGAAAAGAALGGPVGAAIGGGIGFLWWLVGATQEGVAAIAGAGQAVLSLGFFARIGAWVDALIWWCVAGFVLILFLVPASRDNLLAMLSRRVPLFDRVQAFVAATTPFAPSPPAAKARKAKRESRKESKP